MSSWNSHGASGKSYSVRPAASIAWNSPPQMPCMRDFRKSSSYGIALPGDNPCSLRALRVRVAGSKIWFSGRASLSTGIILSIAVAPFSSTPRRALAGQVQRLAHRPRAFLGPESKLKLERLDAGPAQLRLEKIMMRDARPPNQLERIILVRWNRVGDMHHLVAHMRRRHRLDGREVAAHQRIQQTFRRREHVGRRLDDRRNRLRPHHIAAFSEI